MSFSTLKKTWPSAGVIYNLKRFSTHSSILNIIMSIVTPARPAFFMHRLHHLQRTEMAYSNGYINRSSFPISRAWVVVNHLGLAFPIPKWTVTPLTSCSYNSTDRHKYPVYISTRVLQRQRDTFISGLKLTNNARITWMWTQCMLLWYILESLQNNPTPFKYGWTLQS
jgi:hypothetical protein